MPLGQCKSFVRKDGKEAGGRCFGIGEDGKPGSGIWAWCLVFVPNLSPIPRQLVLDLGCSDLCQQNWWCRSE